MERTNGKRIAIVTGSASDWAMNSRDSSSTADGSSPASTSTPNARPNWPANSPGALTAGSSATCPTRTSSKPRWPRSQDRHIDLLINNAGQPSFKTPTAYEAADVDKCLKGLKA